MPNLEDKEKREILALLLETKSISCACTQEDMLKGECTVYNSVWSLLKEDKI